MYEYPHLWLRIRTVTLSLISFASFLWTVFSCFYIFYQWVVISHAERYVVVLLLLVNVITIIVLFILLILPFRTWLDAARCMFLLISHVGLAAAIVYWKALLRCTTADVAKETFCEFAARFILVASWVVPALIVLYVQGLAFVVYRMRKLNARGEETEGDKALSARISVIAPVPSILEPHMGRYHRNTSQTFALQSPTFSVASKPSARLSKPMRSSYY